MRKRFFSGSYEHAVLPNFLSNHGQTNRTSQSGQYSDESCPGLSRNGDMNNGGSRDNRSDWNRSLSRNPWGTLDLRTVISSRGEIMINALGSDIVTESSVVTEGSRHSNRNREGFLLVSF